MKNYLIIMALIAALPASRAELDQKNSTEKIKVIDMHTHVFNARDLPLQGILGRFNVPWPLNAVLAEILLGMADTDELNRSLAADSLKLAVESPAINLTEAQRSELQKLVRVRRQKATDATTLMNSDTSLVIDALLEAGFFPTEAAVPDAERKSLTRSDIKGLLRFIGIMTKNHRDVAQFLSKSAFTQVDLFVHHMMDMENAYDDAPRNLFETQITQVQKVNEELGNFLHFVAFDPFRRDDAMRLVTAGYNAGAIGVKVYPPSGYRAKDNVFPDRPFWGSRRWDRRYAGWTAEQLDAKLEELYKWAEKNKVPLLAHCTPYGFEAASGYGMRADPYYWGEVLKKHPDLYLCFGHGGGEVYWFSEPKDDEKNLKLDLTQPPVDRIPSPSGFKPNLWLFGRQVKDLCLKYKNVYFEVGYLEGILKDEPRKQLLARLEADIKATGEGGWPLGEKIMYGTDWHMMIKEPDYEKYPEACDAVISQISNGTWRRAFFSENAVNFLRLKDSTVLERLSPKQQDAVRTVTGVK